MHLFSAPALVGLLVASAVAYPGQQALSSSPDETLKSLRAQALANLAVAEENSTIGSCTLASANVRKDW